MCHWSMQRIHSIHTPKVPKYASFVVIVKFRSQDNLGGDTVDEKARSTIKLERHGYSSL